MNTILFKILLLLALLGTAYAQDESADEQSTKNGENSENQEDEEDEDEEKE